MHRPIASLVLLAVVASAAALAPPAAAAEANHVLHADGRVEFRVHAPQARSVGLVSWTFPRDPATPPEDKRPPAAPFARAADGAWTFTWGPLAPGVHEYRFRIDEFDTRDPKNPERSTINWSVITVPSPADAARLPWEYDPAVPSGAVHRHRYFNPEAGGVREVLIYTPPGYENSAERRYPVVFLLHGSGGEAGSWTSPVGRADIILDRRVAAGGTPRILVMPNGHVPERDHEGPPHRRFAAFFEDFERHVLPLVESRYRLSADRRDWALAGLSMGGTQTVELMLRNPARFAAVGVFSAGFAWTDEQHREAAPRLASLAAAPASRRPDLLWVACGTNDFAHARARRLVAALEGTPLAPVVHEDDSAHTWAAWRDFLPRFLDLLDARSPSSL
jgi:enterochelin esterase family protein